MGSSAVDQAVTTARLAAIERKLQAIMDHLGIVDVEPSYPEVIECVRRGKRIQAVKLYRDRTGAGLADAKHAVDRMAEQLREVGRGGADHASR
jgi:ribosomal protein L7/L12